MSNFFVAQLGREASAFEQSLYNEMAEYAFDILHLYTDGVGDLMLDLYLDIAHTFDLFVGTILDDMARDIAKSIATNPVRAYLAMGKGVGA